MRRLRVISGLLFGAGLFGSEARADGPPAVDNSAPAVAPATNATPTAPLTLNTRGYAIVVVVDPERPALTARLHAELEDLGLTVQEAAADLPPEALDAMLDGTRVLALVRIDESAPAIEFRVRAPGASELSRDRVAIRPHRADVAAVATVELLRARLIKLGVVSSPAPAPAPLPPPAPAESARFARFSADLSAGAWYSAGGFGLTPTLALGARAHPTRWLAVGALGAFEPQAADYGASEGNVHAHATLLGVTTDFGFDFERVRFELGGGIALTILSLSGTASAPFAGRETSSYGAAPLARAGFGVRLAGPVSLRTQMLAGAASPRVQVRFADRTVAHWGRPLALGLVGLEVGF